MRPYSRIRLLSWPDSADIHNEGRPSRYGKSHSAAKRASRRYLKRVNRQREQRETHFTYTQHDYQ